MKIIEQAKEVLKIEAEGILGLIDKLDENFTKTADLIFNSKGRVVIAGIGKSGLIGRKIVATLNSTGTTSIFLHPVEAMHGDLGVVGKEDIFIGLSNSGETVELNMLLPSIRKIGCTAVAMTGNPSSTLASLSDLVIDVGVGREACPMGLAPTTSTTALLAAGDALAVVLINKRHFKSDDFKKFHPGGALGQRLSSKVQELMMEGEKIPFVKEGAFLKDALSVLDRGNMGAVLVVDDADLLSGIVTDGDIRHFFAAGGSCTDMKVEELMTRSPRHALINTPVYDALNIMEQYQITVLPILSKNGHVKGILHLHDILGKGEFKFKAN